MSSVRPKLKPDVPKAITAWDTKSGKVVWMTAGGGWSETSADLGVFIGDDADAALARAMAQEAIVTDPYVTQVDADGKIFGRELLRETIRATGPTVPWGVDALEVK